MCTVVLKQNGEKKKITLLAEEMTHTPLSPTLGFPNTHSATPWSVMQKVKKGLSVLQSNVEILQQVVQSNMQVL